MENVKQYIYDDNGVLIETKELPYTILTTADIIAKKEAELLAMYNELKVLKGE